MKSTTSTAGLMMMLACASHGLAQAREAQQDKVDLRFTPAKGRILEVSYVEDTTWDYRKLEKPLEMHGTLHTGLTMRWTFEPAKAKGASLTATGSFHSVVYRGEGHKLGSDFDHDIVWNQRKGYLKGMGSKAATTWINDEVNEGVRFAVDGRAAASPGVC